jgi:hypothetical protein
VSTSNFAAISVLITRDIDKLAQTEIKKIKDGIVDGFKSQNCSIKTNGGKLSIEFKDSSEYDKGKIYFEDMIAKMGIK